MAEQKTESTSEKHNKRRSRVGPLAPALTKLDTALADHEANPVSRYDQLTLNQEEIEALKVVVRWAQRVYAGHAKGGGAAGGLKADVARQNGLIPKKRKPGPRTKDQPTS